MTRFGWLVTALIIGICGIVALIGVLLTSSRRPTFDTTVSGTTTEASVPYDDPSTLSIYTSGTYGFSFFYPATATVIDQFTISSTTVFAWRENPIATGTLIARVPIQNAEIRIGTSANAKEIASCTKPGPAEKVLPDTTIGSATWKTFSFDKLGTDAEQSIISYRTLHDDTCFALETFMPQQDLATSTQAMIHSVLQSFTFAN